MIRKLRHYSLVKHSAVSGQPSAVSRELKAHATRTAFRNSD
ncbi:hypothetical protein [Moorena sp. SIO3B2]|nr:hypothetical protein [Moorena sp. SIO3B2]